MVNTDQLNIQFSHFEPENYPKELVAIRPLPARRIQRATHVRVTDKKTGNAYDHVAFCSMNDTFQRSIGRKIALQGVIDKVPVHVKPLIWPSYVNRLHQDIKRGELQRAVSIVEAAGLIN